MLKRLFNFIKSKKGIALVLVIAVVVFFVTRSGSGGEETKTARVQRGEVLLELVLPGQIHSSVDAKLTFPGSGTMAFVNVKEGDLVKKGHVLGKMDTTLLNAAYQQALASWRYTQTTVDRVHDDLKGKDSTETFTEKETRTAAEVANDRAYEAYVIARKSLSDATFISPVSGVVAQIGVDTVGASTTVGTLAFEIIDPSTLYFSVNADQTEVGQIKDQDKVKITLDAFEDNEIEATVASVGLTPKAGQVETVYEIKVSGFTQSDILSQVRVGMSGDATLILEKKENVLYVDAAFVKSDSSGKYVLKGESKEKTLVEVGLEGEDRIEIINGIAEGDLLYQK